jgi:hypothetical protein
MFIVGLFLFGFGYATLYYGANILVSAYLKTTPMNPVPFLVLLGVPGAGAQQGQAAQPTGPQQTPGATPGSIASGAGG